MLPSHKLPRWSSLMEPMLRPAGLARHRPEGIGGGVQAHEAPVVGTHPQQAVAGVHNLP